jgi:hypothetical protein
LNHEHVRKIVMKNGKLTFPIAACCGVREGFAPPRLAQDSTRASISIGSVNHDSRCGVSCRTVIDACLRLREAVFGFNTCIANYSHLSLHTTVTVDSELKLNVLSTIYTLIHILKLTPSNDGKQRRGHSSSSYRCCRLRPRRSRYHLRRCSSKMPNTRDEYFGS